MDQLHKNLRDRSVNFLDDTTILKYDENQSPLKLGRKLKANNDRSMREIDLPLNGVR